MNEIVKTLFAGLTYNENWNYVVLNYTVLLVSMLPYIIPGIKAFTKRIWPTIIVVSILQVSFWFILKVVGISIIWNGILGAIIFDSLRQLKNRSWFYRLVIGISILIPIGLDVYFLIIAPIITTIAHLSAMVVGMLLKKNIR